jgi:hypothetical protein
MSKIVIFKIKGISNLLQNNPASMSKNNGSLGMKRIPTPEEEAAAKCYRDENGNFYILSEAFRASIVGKGGSATGRRIGKFSAASRTCAGIFTVEPRATILDQKNGKPVKKYSIDTRRAVIQNQGILRSRASFENWMVRLPLEIDEDFVTVNQVLDLLNIAGKVAGVGDFRPQRRGCFGRFTAEIES